MTYARSILVAVAACLLVAGTVIAADHRDTTNFVTGSTTYGSISPGGIAAMANYRTTNGTTLSASGDIDRSVLRAAGFFGVTPKAGIDLDLSNDADLEAADVGTNWVFVTTSAGDSGQGPTFTDGASGVLVKTVNTTGGTTCEDKGDIVRCTAYALEGIVCTTYCAD